MRVQDDVRIRVAPMPGARDVAEAVEAEVESGARPDLEHAERQARPCGDLEETAEDGRRAADLVRLDGTSHEVRERRAEPFDGTRQRGGGGRGVAVAAARRIVPCELRRLTAQREAVERAEQAQWQDGTTRVLAERRERGRDRPRRAERVRARGGEVRVERRAHLLAPEGLFDEIVLERARGPRRHSNSTMRSPAATRAPTGASTDFTTASAGAVTSVCIFIASIVSSGSPLLTGVPSVAATFTIWPGIGAPRCFALPGSALRGGALTPVRRRSRTARVRGWPFSSK